MKYNKLLLTIFVISCFAMILNIVKARDVSAATRLIQDQGSSPFCLFAVNSYLVDGDMWLLTAEYYRYNLPTWDGVTPYNENVLVLTTKLYGGVAHIANQWDSKTARDIIRSGIPVAVTGQGHAIVLLSWDSKGRITYVDSLHHEEIKSMKDIDFWKWSDGWYWWFLPK